MSNRTFPKNKRYTGLILKCIKSFVIYFSLPHLFFLVVGLIFVTINPPLLIPAMLGLICGGFMAIREGKKYYQKIKKERDLIEQLNKLSKNQSETAVPVSRPNKKDKKHWAEKILDILFSLLAGIISVNSTISFTGVKDIIFSAKASLLFKVGLVLLGGGIPALAVLAKILGDAYFDPDLKNSIKEMEEEIERLGKDPSVNNNQKELLSQHNTTGNEEENTSSKRRNSPDPCAKSSSSQSFFKPSSESTSSSGEHDPRGRRLSCAF